MRSISRGRVSLRVGKLLLSAIAMAAPIGVFSADWNSTHVFNPKWTPHAKFHNAQTITLSVVTAGLTLWQLWRHWCRFILPVVAGSYALERRRLGVGRAGRGR